MDSAAIAMAVALTFMLAARAARSTGIGVIAAIFTVVVAPRYYDYDKVLFYTLGLAVAWRYADGRSIRTLVGLAVVTAIAGLFRYDNGLFLFAVTATTLVACHWREPWMLTHRVGVYTAGVIVTLAPVAFAWHRAIGLREVARQIETYAVVEGTRTEIFTLPMLRVEAGGSVISSLLNPENRRVILYFAMVALLPTAAAHLAWRAKRPTGESIAHETPKIAPVIVLGTLVAAFILRDPVGARLGVAAPIAAILSAWLAARFMPSRGTTHDARRLVMVLGGAVVLYVALVLSGRSAADLAQVSQTTSAGVSMVRALSRVPPQSSLLPDTQGMVGYVRACTPPGSRVLVDGFVPQVYFFAERGFAGGIPVFFGGHWSAARDQDRTIDQLRREFVPLAIVDPAFGSTYDRVSAYLASEFILAGTSTFGNPRAPTGGYQVFLQRGLGSTTRDDRWNLPCLSGWTPSALDRS